MSFTVTILGSNSAIPAYGRHPSAQIITHRGNKFLVDCGEGTQMRMLQHKVKRGGLNRIFISHLHGDHYFGLIGLITSFSLLGRRNPLYIHAFPALKPIIDLQLESANLKLQYDLIWHFLSGDEELVFSNKRMDVHAIPLHHRIPCVGFIFRERPKPRTYLPDKGAEYGVPVEMISQIKAGEDFVLPSGERVANQELTEPPPHSYSYGYLTDTKPLNTIPEVLKNTDLLYHESTFNAESAARADKTFHTTTEQAAQMAKRVGAKKLVLGHFSAKYHDLGPLLEEARTVFPNTALAIEGETFDLEELNSTS